MLVPSNMMPNPNPAVMQNPYAMHSFVSHSAAKITHSTPRRPVIRNGRLTQGWDEVARSTPAIATRAVATLTTNSGVGDLYRIYALAKRDGVRLQLAYIGDDFEQPHAAEFDRQYMVKLFEYGRAKARSGYSWRGAPPGF
jgi:hypothetical protein